MKRKDEGWAGFDDVVTSFLPDETTETTVAATIELRSRIVKLEQQVLALYTSMASYATVAQRETETARAEARADLDRSQATLIGLIEKVRHEASLRADGAAAEASPGRAAALDRRMDEMAALLDATVKENATLRAEVATLTAQRMADEGWLVSAGPAEGLSLR